MSDVVVVGSGAAGSRAAPRPVMRGAKGTVLQASDASRRPAATPGAGKCAQRTRAKGRAAGGGMEEITQQEMQGVEERGERQGWIELSRQRVRDGIVPRGCALIAAMLETVAARGANLVTNARARELLMTNGRV